jgi:hypothetical protein
MIVYSNSVTVGYKSNVPSTLLDITKKSVEEVTSLSAIRAAPPQFKVIKTPIKRKLTSENSEFIESLGFKVKKQNA